MPKASKGLSPRTFKGLNKKRMEKKGGNFNRIVLKQGDTKTVQFLDGIEEFLEYENHAFKDGSRWQYVPCAGDDCPLCADEDHEVSKTGYRFCANVYSFEDKKVLILEGPKDLAGRVAGRYERVAKKGGSWTKLTWDVSKLPTTPVSYDVERADDRPVRLDGLERHDLEEYVTGEMVRYFGDDMPTAKSGKPGPSSLDDDDDWDDEDEDEFDDEEAYTEDELLAMKPSELGEAAEEVGLSMKGKKITKDNRKKLIAAIIRKQQ